MGISYELVGEVRGASWGGRKADPADVHYVGIGIFVYVEMHFDMLNSARK